MVVIILCAGKGARAREVTGNIPESLYLASVAAKASSTFSSASSTESSSVTKPGNSSHVTVYPPSGGITMLHDIKKNRGLNLLMSDTIDNFPFFIATERRTGSHLLMNLLRNNARFGLIDVFKPEREFNDIEITDIFNHFLSLRNDKDARWGLKLYSTGISTVNRYSELIGNPPLKWIFLRRKDKLAQALSRVRQKMTNISHLRSPNTEKNITELRNLEVVPSPENIQLVMTQMIQFCKREIRWFDFFKENSIHPLEIFYEDFMEEKDRKETVTKILDYLEMDYTSSIDSSTQYIRTSPTIFPSIYKKIKREIERYDR